MFPWQTQLFVARPRPIRRREFHVCPERYAILMSQGKTYARVLRLLLELAFTSGRDANFRLVRFGAHLRNSPRTISVQDEIKLRGCQRGSANASPGLRAIEPLPTRSGMFLAAASPQEAGACRVYHTSASQMPLKTYSIGPFAGG